MAETTRKLMLVAVLAMLAGAGCTTGPTTRPVTAAEPAAGPSTGPVPSGAGAASPVPGSAGEAHPRNPAVVSLEATARQFKASGDLERAAASLERALRIDPDDAESWLALAGVRLEQGRTEQAAGLARRAETLADPGSETAAKARALAARAGGR